MAAALHWMQGVRELPAYDWTSARYVLSLGSGLLDSSCQLVHFARHQVAGAACPDRDGRRRGPYASCISSISKRRSARSPVARAS